MLATEDELAPTWRRTGRAFISMDAPARSSRCLSASTTTAFRASRRPALPAEQQRLRELFGLRADIIGLGVDRLDYTKGILERLAALDAPSYPAAGAPRTADVHPDRRSVPHGARELRAIETESTGWTPSTRGTPCRGPAGRLLHNGA